MFRFIFLLSMTGLIVCQNNANDVDADTVNLWASKFGNQLWQTLKLASRKDEIQKGYDEHPGLTVEKIDGLKIVKRMSDYIQLMLQRKINALKRIKDEAENAALNHNFDIDMGNQVKEGRYCYMNAKKITKEEDDEDCQLVLTPNKHFSMIPVNTSRSAVYVPTSVSDQKPKVINAIDWSKKLDHIFSKNYKKDPSLNWQYFASSSGFLRLYPAKEWSEDNNWYDARMTDWYSKASSPSKDVIILLDDTESMTEMEKEISRKVAITILETLSENDFVTVLPFSNGAKSLIPCFQYKDEFDLIQNELVQATNDNILLLTEAINFLHLHKPEGVVDLHVPLEEGLDMLNRYRSKRIGTEGDQALMLITNNITQKYPSLFMEYNEPHKPIRIFPFIIGESTDLEAAKWMACNYKGYFSQVTNLTEVKEKVLNYMSVMARPSVLIINEEKYPLSALFRWNIVNDVIQVSIPVISKKKQMSPEELGIKSNFVVLVRVAELLGVAGIDVPIKEMKKWIPPYKLGVNGYSFAVNNNGYIIFHPDHRKYKGNKNQWTSMNFNKTVGFNDVDFSEVELPYNPDHEDEPRYNDSSLFSIRKDLVHQKEGIGNMRVKVHMDNMKRVTEREQNYFYTQIHPRFTPYSLGIALPAKYGEYRVSGGLNPSQMDVSDHAAVTRLLPITKEWRLHPDWDYFHDDNFDTSEEKTKHFLGGLLDTPTPFIWPPCNQELVMALLLDARITKMFSWEEDDSRKDLCKQFGIKLSFLSTRSGLTRWEDFNKNDTDEELHFSKTNAKAIDELWYKRAVDYHFKSPDSFLFSVPHDLQNHQMPIIVTASIAIIKEEGNKKAPAGVVGVQIDHEKFTSAFMDVTNEYKNGKKISCQNESQDQECYVLDNNGFVLISRNQTNVGKFFGEIEGKILKSLIQKKVFKKMKIYDYQQYCQLQGRNDDKYKVWPKPCDLETDLFELNEEAFEQERSLKGISTNCEGNCERNFSLTKIPHTNLVLIVVDRICPCAYDDYYYFDGVKSDKISIDRKYSDSDDGDYGLRNGNCSRMKRNLYRRKHWPNFFYHPEEEEIAMCGEENL